jgi:hypothetical protein
LNALHPGDAAPATAIKLKADPQEKFAKLLQNLLKLPKVVCEKGEGASHHVSLERSQVIFAPGSFASIRLVFFNRVCNL